MNPESPPTGPLGPTTQRKDGMLRRLGARLLRYRDPQENGRGDFLSPTAEAKRRLKAGLEAVAGRPLSPRQVRRLRKVLKRAQAREVAPDVSVAEAGPA